MTGDEFRDCPVGGRLAMPGRRERVQPDRRRAAECGRHRDGPDAHRVPAGGNGVLLCPCAGMGRRQARRHPPGPGRYGDRKVRRTALWPARACRHDHRGARGGRTARRASPAGVLRIQYDRRGTAD